MDRQPKLTGHPEHAMGCDCAWCFGQSMEAGTHQHAIKNLMALLRESTDELTYFVKRYGRQWNTTELASVNNQIAANEAVLAKVGEE